MEEAEALATKLGIMVTGKIKCFGSTNHIREKFGQGYEIEMNLDVQDILKDLNPISVSSNEFHKEDIFLSKY